MKTTFALLCVVAAVIFHGPGREPTLSAVESSASPHNEIEFALARNHTEFSWLIKRSESRARAPDFIHEAPEQEPQYEALLFARDTMVPMRDGVRLASDIYRPAIGGVPVQARFPTLLQRTPYGKATPGIVASAEYFAQHGYVVVLQDIRGRYGSEGTFSKYHAFDATDGYDTVEWIASLPYSDSQVGMWGTSYGAHTQADAAKLAPPHLRTIVLNMGGLSNGWDHKIRNHGAFELGQQLGWAFSQLAADTDESVARQMLELETVNDWFVAMPFRKGLNPLSIAPEFEDYVLKMMTRGDYDEYWQAIGRNWVEYYDDTADIPMLHVSGWYDTYAGGTISNWQGLAGRKSAPIRLLIGPWDHGGNARSSSGDVEFGAAAAISDFGRAFHLRWFDHYLKGKQTGVEDGLPIRLFVMGTGDGSRDENGRLVHGGYWREADSWPLQRTELRSYYFRADGGLSTEAPPMGVPSTTYTYDPHGPVPTIGGSFSGALKRGPYDQREREFKRLGGSSANGFYGSQPPYLPLRARPDVVVFQTPPLPQDVEVVGPIRAVLYASSSAVDTDFTAKLVDVYPPSEDFPQGFDMNLTDGIIRARYRESPDRQVRMRPGEVYRFEIVPFPTANVFKAGHRIRIDISSSNWPRFDVNPNTGDLVGQHRGMIPADNSIHHDAEHASHVVLPVVPSRVTAIKGENGKH